MKLTIIIPCYNGEKTIERCIDSCLAQNFKEYEILVINDGSNDNTLNILEHYQKNHPERIRIISQHNGGLSVARNTGIENAKGVYLMYVDADDTIEEDSLHKMFDYIITEYPEFDFNIDDNYLPDLIFFGSREIPLNKKPQEIVSFELKKYDNPLPFFYEIFDSIPFSSSWGKLYKKSHIIANGLTYEPGLNKGQDLVFSCRDIYVKSVLTVPVFVYNYIRTPDSVTLRFHGDKHIYYLERGRESILYFSRNYLKNPETENYVFRLYSFLYLFLIYDLYRVLPVTNKYHWVKRFWTAADQNIPGWSKQLNKGIPKFAGILGRHSKLFLHLFLITIFSIQKLKYRLSK